MKTIMFFILSLKMGGSEKACVRMANVLCKKYDVTICTFFGDGELKNEVDPQVQVRSIFPRFFRGGARLAHIPAKLAYRLFVRSKYDIEIAVGDGLESHVISGSPNPNKYSWIHINLGYSGTRFSSKSVQRYQQFKKIICVSNTNKNCFVGEMGSDYDIAIAYTPIDRDDVIRKGGDKVRKGNLPKVLASIGRLEQVKGYDRLIRAAAQLQELPFEIHIYGDGTKRKELQELIADNNLQNRVFLEGFIDNPYPVINNADALICSSESESFGFAVVEAMLLHTPVISTKCGGVEEIIQNEEQGILCENSEEGIRCGIEHFVNGKHEINTEEAFERACSFDVESCAKAFCQIIEE